MTFDQWWAENKDDVFASALGARTHSDAIDQRGEEILRNVIARAWNGGVDCTVDPSNHIRDLYAKITPERP